MSLEERVIKVKYLVHTFLPKMPFTVPILFYLMPDSFIQMNAHSTEQLPAIIVQFHKQRKVQEATVIVNKLIAVAQCPAKCL